MEMSRRDELLGKTFVEMIDQKNNEDETRGRNYLPEKDVTELKKLHDGEHTLEEIADILNIKYQTLMSRRKNLVKQGRAKKEDFSNFKINFNNPHRRLYTEEEDEVIIRMKMDDFMISQIAEELNRTKSAIKGRIRVLKLKGLL